MSPSIDILSRPSLSWELDVHRLKFSILVCVITGVGLQKCQLAVLHWVILGLYFSVLAHSAVDTQANFNLSVFYYISEAFKPNMVPCRMWLSIRHCRQCPKSGNQ